MEEFLRHYGYAALSLGTFLEGETAILAASSLADSGLFFLPYVVFFGFLGSFISDWVYYLIGRLNGKYFLAKRPVLHEKLRPVRKFFNTHRLQILFSYRFLYGFRIIIPVMFGMSDLKPLHYLGYSLAAGLLWASTVSSAGYFVGKALGVRPSTFEANIAYVMIGFGVLGLILGYTIKRFAERKMKIDPDEGI
jgi:membrane protein DedA with SNARE-associated domain